MSWATTLKNGVTNLKNEAIQNISKRMYNSTPDATKNDDLSLSDPMPFSSLNGLFLSDNTEYNYKKDDVVENIFRIEGINKWFASYNGKYGFVKIEDILPREQTENTLSTNKFTNYYKTVYFKSLLSGKSISGIHKDKFMTNITLLFNGPSNQQFEYFCVDSSTQEAVTIAEKEIIQNISIDHANLWNGKDAINKADYEKRTTEKAFLRQNMSKFQQPLKKVESPIPILGPTTAKGNLASFLSPGSNLSSFLSGQHSAVIVSSPDTIYYPGLENKNNYCFANSLFQVLACFKPFTEKYIGPALKYDKKSPLLVFLVNQILQILSELNKRSDKPVTLSLEDFYEIQCQIMTGKEINNLMKGALNKMCERKVDGSIKQHDSGEFLLILFDTIDTLFKEVGMTGNFSTTYCGISKQTFRVYDSDIIPINNDTMTLFFLAFDNADEIINLDLKVGGTNDGNEVIKYVPEASNQGIIFQANRSFLGGNKQTNKVIVPVELTVGGIGFNLCGFTIHSGEEGKSGHYIAYAQRNDTGWFKFDDGQPSQKIENIKHVLESAEIQKNIMLVFYNKSAL